MLSVAYLNTDECVPQYQLKWSVIHCKMLDATASMLDEIGAAKTNKGLEYSAKSIIPISKRAASDTSELT